MQNCFISVLFRFCKFYVNTIYKIQNWIETKQCSHYRKIWQNINKSNFKTKVRNPCLKLIVIFVTNKNNDYTALVCM